MLTAKERMEICKACPNLKLNFCKECGCFMPAKTKLKWASCPIGKWEATEPEPTDDIEEMEAEVPVYKNEAGLCCADQAVFLPDGTEKKMATCWECDDG